MVVEFDKFYVTRYMGAKYKLLDFILPPVTNLLREGESFVDLMAGTHSVGYALKKRNRIIANDIQHYSKVFGEAIIENNTLSNIHFRFSKDFDELDINRNISNWFIETYSDTYFDICLIEYRSLYYLPLFNSFSTSLVFSISLSSTNL